MRKQFDYNFFSSVDVSVTELIEKGVISVHWHWNESHFFDQLLAQVIDLLHCRALGRPFQRPDNCNISRGKRPVVESNYHLCFTRN